MEERTVILLPKQMELLKQMGGQIKLARLRRNLSTVVVCERAHISRPTLNKIENGDPSVGIGFYAAVLFCLGGLDKDLLKIASDDELGRTIQDLNIKVKRRID